MCEIQNDWWFVCTVVYIMMLSMKELNDNAIKYTIDVYGQYAIQCNKIHYDRSIGTIEAARIHMLWGRSH